MHTLHPTNQPKQTKRAPPEPSTDDRTNDCLELALEERSSPCLCSLSRPPGTAAALDTRCSPPLPKLFLFSRLQTKTKKQNKKSPSTTSASSTYTNRMHHPSHSKHFSQLVRQRRPSPSSEQVRICSLAHSLDSPITRSLDHSPLK